MRILATAARGLKNMWAQGEEEDYIDEEDGFDSDEIEADTPSYRYTSERDLSGYSSSAARPQTMRSAPTSLRTKEKNIYTLRPKNQDDAAVAADYLKGGSAVIVNLENIDYAAAVRIIDFMSGVCYGLEGQGHAMKLGDSIFLFTPTEFEISSDEVGYGKNHDFYFKNIGSESQKPKAPTSKPQPQSTSAETSAASTAQESPAVAASGMPTASRQPASYTTPSGYVTADYAAPASSATPRAASPSPSTSATVRPRSASSFSSSGKAHVMVSGKPVDTSINTASDSTSTAPGTYQSNERRSWER